MRLEERLVEVEAAAPFAGEAQGAHQVDKNDEAALAVVVEEPTRRSTVSRRPVSQFLSVPFDYTKLSGPFQKAGPGQTGGPPVQDMDVPHSRLVRWNRLTPENTAMSERSLSSAENCDLFRGKNMLEEEVICAHFSNIPLYDYQKVLRSVADVQWEVQQIVKKV